MDINNFLKQKSFKIIVFAVGAVILLLLVFKAGVFVGYKKASFSYRWGENYHRNFGDFINAHGTSGSIIKIDGSTLIVKSGDNVEKTILISEKTTITSRRETIKAGDFKVDDRVVVIGSPNEQGQIEAKFIRLF